MSAMKGAAAVAAAGTLAPAHPGLQGAEARTEIASLETGDPGLQHIEARGEGEFGPFRASGVLDVVEPISLDVVSPAEGQSEWEETVVLLREFTDRLRELAQIFTACIGPGHASRVYDSTEPDNANAHWHTIATLLDREIESFGNHMPKSAGESAPYQWCMAFLMSEPRVADVLSLVEVCCRYLQVLANAPRHEQRARGAVEDPAQGLLEVNARFKNAGVGYQYEAGEIIRVDSQYVHGEVVKPASELLSAPEFEEANREFRLAHEHYRSGNLRDCNTAALRCMEAVMKAICDVRGWRYDAGATVEKLIAVVRREGLFPDYLGGYFDNLIGAMKAGLPKIRDRDGGHGAPPGQPKVPEHVAGFALHLTASNIVMLAQAHSTLAIPGAQTSAKRG
jgi:hypothetical protein